MLLVLILSMARIVREHLTVNGIHNPNAIISNFVESSSLSSLSSHTLQTSYDAKFMYTTRLIVFDTAIKYSMNFSYLIKSNDGWLVGALQM